MAVFAPKTCADILAKLRRPVEVIASYPPSAPNTAAAEELLKAARLLAKRALQLLKKVAGLDIKTALALENKLRLLEAAPNYPMLRSHAGTALVLIEDLEQACAEKLGRKEAAKRPKIILKRGPIGAYGRMMTTVEYKRLLQIKALESADPGELIPAFKAPAFLIKKFLNYYDKTAIRNIYSHLGGTGNVDYVVFFSTDVVPTDMGQSRRWPEIFEVKFPHGTPAAIFQVRRV